MGAKRAVPGRSLPYDVLLASYQKKNQAKQQSEFSLFFFSIHSNLYGPPLKLASKSFVLEDLVLSRKAQLPASKRLHNNERVHI